MTEAKWVSGTDQEKPMEFLMESDHGKKRTYWLIWFFVLVVLVLLCGLFPFQVVWDDGMKEMTFHFLVLDAKTKQPLQDVRIALYEEAPETLQEIRTGANGEASLDLPCMIACKIRSGIILSYSKRSIYYPHRMLVVSRSGFKKTPPLSLTDLVGWGHAGDYLPPSAVQIELESE